MATGKVSLADVYEITNRIEEKLDKIGERVSILEVWKAEIMGKLAVVGAVFIFAANFVVDWIKERFKI